jgi:hypothetical protein
MANFTYNNFNSLLIQGKLPNGFGVIGNTSSATVIPSNINIALIGPDQNNRIPEAVNNSNAVTYEGANIDSYLAIGTLPMTLNNPSVIFNNTDNIKNTIFTTLEPPIWSASSAATIKAICAVLYYKNAVSFTDIATNNLIVDQRPLLALIDFGEVKETSLGGSFSISWSNQGIFRYSFN